MLFSDLLLMLALVVPLVLSILAAIFDPRKNHYATFFTILLISYGLSGIIVVISSIVSQLI
tara:strand:+ start:422 stop:604 length:183 start_codon:yes stop_codon:yes gene_type:complete